MNEETRKMVLAMTLMSDILFNAVMNNNKECMEYILKIIMDKADLQVGDLVFFGSGSSITHAGIYAGSGQFIHAPNSRSTVSYSDLTTGYWAQTYYGACRVAQ